MLLIIPAVKYFSDLPLQVIFFLPVLMAPHSIVDLSPCGLCLELVGYTSRVKLFQSEPAPVVGRSKTASRFGTHCQGGRPHAVGPFAAHLEHKIHGPVFVLRLRVAQEAEHGPGAHGPLLRRGSLDVGEQDGRDDIAGLIRSVSSQMLLLVNIGSNKTKSPLYKGEKGMEEEMYTYLVHSGILPIPDVNKQYNEVLVLIFPTTS
jgi:hypothetical protein